MYSTITIDEFKRHRTKDNIQVIDVREKKDFLCKHLPEAINIPVDELTTSFQSLDPSKTYYFICYKGVRSKQAANFLSSQGFCAFNVEGGMQSWK